MGDKAVSSRTSVPAKRLDGEGASRRAASPQEAPVVKVRSQKEKSPLPRKKRALRPGEVRELHEKWQALSGAQAPSMAWDTWIYGHGINSYQLKCIDALSGQFGAEIFSINDEQMRRTLVAMSKAAGKEFSTKEARQVVDGLVARNTVFSCHDALRVTREVTDILANHASGSLESLHGELLAYLRRANVLLVEAFCGHMKQDQFFAQLLKVVASFKLEEGKSDDTRADEIDQLRLVLRSLRQAAKARKAERLDLGSTTPDQKKSYASETLLRTEKKERRKRVSQSMTTDSALGEAWARERGGATGQQQVERRSDAGDAKPVAENRFSKQGKRVDRKSMPAELLLAFKHAAQIEAVSSESSPYKSRAVGDTATNTEAKTTTTTTTITARAPVQPSPPRSFGSGTEPSQGQQMALSEARRRRDANS